MGTTPELPRSDQPVTRRQGFRWIVVVVVSVLAGAGWGLHRAYREVRDSSKLKAMLPRQPAAALDQFFLEYEDRIFIGYAELIGPGCYIKSYNAVDGEDLSRQFPMRRAGFDSMPVRLPDGSTVVRTEVIAAVGRSGLVSTYPRPQEDRYDPKRVYQLDSGVAIRGNRVVNLPPDPAGREGRDQNGVHTYSFPDGRRYEITYRGGVPDGPFRAFYGDGTRWGEAEYRRGRVVRARVFSRTGEGFDELKDGPAASAGLEAGAKAKSDEVANRARHKLVTGDRAGAIEEFTAALNIHKSAFLFLERAGAKAAGGDFDGAISDCAGAKTWAATTEDENRATRKMAEYGQRKSSR